MSAVTSMRHFGLVVGDLPRALGFYAGIMGLRADPAREEGGEALDAVLGGAGIRVTTVKLRAGTGETRLELLRFWDPAVIARPAGTVFHQQGPTHLALTVEDLGALLAKIRAAGCEVISPARVSADGQASVAFCRDFEGNLLELVEPAGPAGLGPAAGPAPGPAAGPGRSLLGGKTVLLTGAAGGIGLALLEGLLRAGATVRAVTRRGDTDWGGLREAFPGTLRPELCDLGREGEVRALAGRVGADGGPEVLINNASDCPHLTGDVYSLDILRRVLAVTLEAAYVLCGELAPLMARRGKGSIINVTSMNAERAWPGNPPYIAAKAALRMLTLAVARDHGERGVRANNLTPGYVHTRLTAASHADPAGREERRGRTMLGRWGAPADLVGPCLFLASDASAYVTGIDLHVDGGWLAKGM
jgi:NAD(P)-dependent dehydrogenase (short-subunit alcohol dehydrogenase family)/catechol 2,3-dioxygenase-like lactoylglutathione lyase family enzyme